MLDQVGHERHCVAALALIRPARVQQAVLVQVLAVKHDGQPFHMGQLHEAWRRVLRTAMLPETAVVAKTLAESA